MTNRTLLASQSVCALLASLLANCGVGSSLEASKTSVEPVDRATTQSDDSTSTMYRRADGSFVSLIDRVQGSTGRIATAHISVDGIGVLEVSSGTSSPVRVIVGTTEMVNAQVLAALSAVGGSGSGIKPDLACSPWSGGACCCGSDQSIGTASVTCECCTTGGACQVADRGTPQG